MHPHPPLKLSRRSMESLCSSHASFKRILDLFYLLFDSITGPILACVSDFGPFGEVWSAYTFRAFMLSPFLVTLGCLGHLKPSYYVWGVLEIKILSKSLLIQFLIAFRSSLCTFGTPETPLYPLLCSHDAYLLYMGTGSALEWGRSASTLVILLI